MRRIGGEFFLNYTNLFESQEFLTQRALRFAKTREVMQRGTRFRFFNTKVVRH